MDKGNVEFCDTTNLLAGLARLLWFHANTHSPENYTVTTLYTLTSFHECRDVAKCNVDESKVSPIFWRYLDDCYRELACLDAKTCTALKNLIFLYGSGRNFMHYHRRIAKLCVSPKYREMSREEKEQLQHAQEAHQKEMAEA